MKYVDEYCDARVAHALSAEIAQRTTRRWVLMEICGGQTHTIMRYGLDELLPADIELVHGPGCPVCVTPLETVDEAIELASRPDVTLVSSGDMLRVPGSNSDLATVVDDTHRVVTLRTDLGTTRIVDMLAGDQLPRIC